MTQSNVQSMTDMADALEMRQMQELGDKIIGKSRLYAWADGEYTANNFGFGKRMLMGEDPRLPKMPEKPNLLDFFKYRMAVGGEHHLLQSANLAQMNGLPEKMILGCLLHDFSVTSFIRSDHGYWGAQLLEPYVDEEVVWAIRYHQALRFYPDESVGYHYPDNYVRMFGVDYRPDPYIQADYEYARNHKWYMEARMICVNDLYSFDPDVHVEVEQFEDIVGRNFRQPPEGLGNDRTSSSHMWRTMIRPSNAL